MPMKQNAYKILIWNIGHKRYLEIRGILRVYQKYILKKHTVKFGPHSCGSGPAVGFVKAEDKLEDLI
jgi:hypothetical protein